MKIRKTAINSIGNNQVFKNEKSYNKFLEISVYKTISRIIKLLRSQKYLFINLRKVLYLNQLLDMYYSHVKSRLEYGICIWGNSINARDLFIIQKCILRTLTKKSRRFSCRPLIKQYNILPLPCLFIFKTSGFTHLRKHELPKKERLHTYNTSRTDKIHTSLTCTSKSLDFIRPHIYNLPRKITFISQIYLFKN